MPDRFAVYFLKNWPKVGRPDEGLRWCGGLGGVCWWAFHCCGRAGGRLSLPVAGQRREEGNHKLESAALTPDLPALGAHCLSWGDLHRLNIYTIWMFYYSVMMAWSLPLPLSLSPPPSLPFILRLSSPQSLPIVLPSLPDHLSIFPSGCIYLLTVCSVPLLKT